MNLKKNIESMKMFSKPDLSQIVVDMVKMVNLSYIHTKIHTSSVYNHTKIKIIKKNILNKKLTDHIAQLKTVSI